MTSRRKYRMLVFLCLLSSAALVFLFISRHANGDRGTYLQRLTASTDHRDSAIGAGLAERVPFVVDTPGCKIPNIDPYDVSVRHLVTADNSSIVRCTNTTPPMTYIDADRYLRINRTAIAHHYDDELDYCQYQAIYRPTDELPPVPVDDRFAYRRSVQFNEDIDLEPTNTEFLRVACYGKHSGILLYTNFHAVILRKPSIDKVKKVKLARFAKGKHSAEVFNFLIIGVDSVSRLNFVRQMTRSRHFLLNDLNAYELLGYNKVADNTYVNLVPMFAGRFVEELPWDERMSDIPFDNYTFFWNKLSDRGYMTLYAEDAPSIAIFNYNKAGFHRPPADYYLRPFSLALEDHGSIWNAGRDCVGSRLETEVVLDYILDFERRYRRRPHLSFAFLTRLTHEDVRKTASADQAYFRLLRRLRDERLLDRTVIVFYSDHGIRFGELRGTYVGKMEERLPFAYVRLPPSFAARYPSMAQSLAVNTGRLTTPFDIYETLVNLMDFTGRLPAPNNVSNRRGCTLLADVPETRTCESAAILPHWCTCHATEQLRVDAHDVLQAAGGVVHYINGVVGVHGGRCAVLRLLTVVDARRVLPKNDVMRFRNSRRDVIGRTVEFDNISETSGQFFEYQLTLETTPGRALFEATVRQKGNTSVEVAFVSRINAYGDQSVCIDFHSHKKFCYCV